MASGLTPALDDEPQRNCFLEENNVQGLFCLHQWWNSAKFLKIGSILDMTQAIVCNAASKETVSFFLICDPTPQQAVDVKGLL